MGEQGPDLSSTLKKEYLDCSPHPPVPHKHSPCTLSPWSKFSMWIQKNEVVGGQNRWDQEKKIQGPCLSDSPGALCSLMP